MLVFMIMVGTPQIIFEKVKFLIKDEVLSGEERGSFIETRNVLAKTST